MPFVPPELHSPGCSLKLLLKRIQGSLGDWSLAFL